MPSPLSPTVGDLFAVLSSPHRRAACYHLLDAESTTVDALADEIRRRECREGDDRTDPLTDPSVTLVHNHLPRLADHWLVEYDDETGAVARGDAFADVRPIVESIRTVEEDEDATVESAFALGAQAD
ncbi:hypothetical protein [Halovivax sp.]|uniref:DUF7344 domain-containing protein n=1 Tax=Halovivax sp. TaxID=1935978 RepID=UPI0025BB324B|nr:hypothetical protein [Halovivax sp.]